MLTSEELDSLWPLTSGLMGNSAKCYTLLEALAEIRGEKSEKIIYLAKARFHVEKMLEPYQKMCVRLRQ